ERTLRPRIPRAAGSLPIGCNPPLRRSETLAAMVRDPRYYCLDARPRPQRMVLARARFALAARLACAARQVPARDEKARADISPPEGSTTWEKREPRSDA